MRGLEQYREVEGYRRRGLTIAEACERVGMKRSTYGYHRTRQRKKESGKQEQGIDFSEFIVEGEESDIPMERNGSDRIVIKVSLRGGGQMEVNVSSEVLDIESLLVRAGVIV